MNNDKQSCLRYTTYIVGYGLIIITLLLWIYLFLINLLEGWFSDFSVSTYSFITALANILLLFFFTLGVVVYFCFLFVEMFPVILIAEEGIEYKGFKIRDRIDWSEIEGVKKTKWRNNIYAIIIDRKGSSFFHPKGLYRNYVYGIWSGIYRPVLFITIDEKNLPEITNLIAMKGGKK